MKPVLLNTFLFPHIYCFCLYFYEELINWILCVLDLSRMTHEFYMFSTFLIVDFTITSYQVKTIENIPIVVMLLFYILVGVNYIYIYIYTHTHTHMKFFRWGRSFIYIYIYETLVKVIYIYIYYHNKSFIVFEALLPYIVSEPWSW